MEQFSGKLSRVEPPWRLKNNPGGNHWLQLSGCCAVHLRAFSVAEIDSSQDENIYCLSSALHSSVGQNIQDATLSQGVPRDAAVNFGATGYYRCRRCLKNLAVAGYAHAPFSPKFIMGFCSDGPSECTSQI